ncbi:MAG: hypothetical protein KF752_07485 [Pirellulaceae bacterium]|nr:hypothetical protein [Pirellulaceae bacterium]
MADTTGLAVHTIVRKLTLESSITALETGWRIVFSGFGRVSAFLVDGINDIVNIDVEMLSSTVMVRLPSASTAAVGAPVPPVAKVMVAPLAAAPLRDRLIVADRLAASRPRPSH